MKLLKQHDPRYHLDFNRPFDVYRNLHQNCWSIRQDGLVKAHADIAHLDKPSFVVRNKARLKVIANKRKEVHAWVRGILHPKPESIRALGDETWTRVKYKPEDNETFVTYKGEPISQASRAWLILPMVWAI